MIFIPLITLAFAMLTPGSGLLENSAQVTDQEKLQNILEKTADYCRKLEKASLFFVCREEIQEYLLDDSRPSSYGRVNKYIYDYQMIRKAEKITERRTLVQEDGRKRFEENAELKTQRFWHEHVIFGPLGLLGDVAQESHDFRIIGDESWKHRRAIVIEALPKKPEAKGHLYGKIWIDSEDYSVLKIEWDQSSMKNIEELEKKALKQALVPKITFISEYDLEKNGIRFPSRYVVKEEYLHPRWGRFTASETQAVYEDYKFFLVETEVTIK